MKKEDDRFLLGLPIFRGELLNFRAVTHDNYTAGREEGKCRQVLGETAGEQRDVAAWFNGKHRPVDLWMWEICDTIPYLTKKTNTVRTYIYIYTILFDSILFFGLKYISLLHFGLYHPILYLYRLSYSAL